MDRHVNAPTRRSLMTAAAGASALVAAAPFLPSATRGPAAPQQAPTANGGGGYHVTEHVRRYYRSTRL